MNALILRRLVWKEFRTTAAIWVAMAGLCLVLDIGQAALPRSSVGIHLTPEQNYAWFYSIAMVVTALYAVACAGMQYAVEHENGTFGLLRSLPLTTRDVFWTKAGWASASTAILAVFLVGMTFLWTGGQPLPRERVAVYGMFILEGLAWGTFFSLLASRAMTAIFQAGIVIALCLGGLSSLYAWLGNVVFSDQTAIRIYASVWPYRLLIVAVVAALDVQLGLRWFERWKIGGKGGRMAESLANNLGGQWRMPHRARRGEFWELCRHHVRQSRTILGLFALLVLLLFISSLLAWAGVLRHGTSELAGLAACGCMIGAVVYPSLAFHADQRWRGYRFLSHHGVAPRKAWWSRQLVWTAFYVLQIFLFFSVLFLSKGESPARVWEALRDTPNIATNLGIAVALFFTAYASGSLVSVLVRSGILAVGLGMTLTIGMLSLDAFLVQYLGWMPVLAIPVGLFVAGRLHAADWLAERRSWRSRVRWMTPALAPFVLLALATPTIRIHQYPDYPDPGFSPSHLQAEAYSPEGFARLGELITISRLPRLEKVFTYPERERLSGSPGYFEAKAEKGYILSDVAFKRLVAFATADPKPGPYQEMAGAGPWPWLIQDHAVHVPPRATVSGLSGALEMTIAYYGQTGRLREALEGRLARARLIAIAPSYGGFWSGFRVWARQKGMTAELLREGIKRLDELRPGQVDYTLGFKLSYLVAEREITDDEYFRGVHGEVPTARRLLPKLYPWERVRALRRLRCLYRQNLEEIESFTDSCLDPNAPPLDRDSRDGSPERHKRDHFEDACEELLFRTNLWWLVSYPPSGRVEDFETQRRVAQIELAVEAWRLEHGGKLPESLDVLVGVYFKKLPVDPVSKRPFRLRLDKDWEYGITSE